MPFRVRVVACLYVRATFRLDFPLHEHRKQECRRLFINALALSVVCDSKVKRRVVKRAFYSSEEDESTEEDVETQEQSNNTTPEVSDAVSGAPHP